MPRFGHGRRTAAAALLSALCATTLLNAQAAQLGGAIGSAQQSFLEQHPGAAFYFESDGYLSRVYGAAFSHGASAVESADAFLQQHAGVLGSSFGHLLPIGPNGDGAHVLQLGYNAADESHRFSLVGYTQHVNGIPVFRGDVRCLVRNEPGYPLVLVANALKNVSAFAETFTGRPISPSQVDVRKASRLPLNQFGPGAKISHQEQVIWAGYDGAPAKEPRLAYKFIVTGTGVFDRSLYQRMLYVVDAATNKILFQEDQISHADVSVNVRGNATSGTAADACNPEAPVGLPHARVTANGVTYFADANGNVVIPNPTDANVSITSSMLTAGRYFNVNDAAATGESSITQASTGGVLEFLHNAANTDESDRAEVNAYFQANKVRDYLLTYNPTFPTIANQLSWPINVQVTGTCNAFYDGASINFYPAGGGCNNTAFSVVVHHEFGHHIVATAGSGQGAYGEGFGDVMGVLVTDESRLAVGFQTCTTGIRDANNLNQYVAGAGCSSAGSAIHTCGTLLSGCVWDVRNNLAATNPTTYRSIISNLAIDSVLLHSGTSITPQITIDFLTLDDNDANIGNGTPHYPEINGGFTEHGMPGPAVELVGFSFPDGIPAQASPNGGTSFRVNVTGISGTPAPGTGRLFYSIGTGAFTSVPMTESAANQYVASLPASTCGTNLRFYVAANATTGSTGTSPSNAPTTFYSAISATGFGEPFIDTAETAVAGWTTSTAGDTATSGVWVRADPVGTVNAGIQVQPETDVTAAPGVNCFFTGQGTPGGTLGAADVDGGATTLTSPTMDATGGEAYLSYYRWYSNQQGGAPNADVFRVQISNNNGASWTALETVGPAGAEVNGGWISKEFRIADVIPPTNQMRVRFIAEDLATGSLIEAAIDEVRVRVVECTPTIPGDLDGDGIVGGADLAMMLNNWNGIGVGDINNDGGVDGIDLGILLNNWTN
ncbi:MAG: hypothetical protein RLZZ116_2125 [Planctomycetota bacterium]|jgi:Zn-dependent metalloprotease